MLLINFGNTSITAVRSRQSELLDLHIFAATEDSLTSVVSWVLACPNSETVVVSSVVPALSEKFVVCLAQTELEIFNLECVCDKIIAHRLKSVSETGIDRLLAVRAALAEFGGPLVVVDVGTAVTVDLVDAVGVFLGGAILPGPWLWLDSLHQGTERLPQLSPTKSQAAFGAFTQAAMLAGLNYGLPGAVEKLVENYCFLLKGEPCLVLTGGGSDFIKDKLTLVYQHRPDLVMQGMLLTAQEFAGVQDV